MSGVCDEENQNCNQKVNSNEYVEEQKGFLVRTYFAWRWQQLVQTHKGQLLTLHVWNMIQHV